MESVLAESNKVLLDVKEGSSLMYLPLDQMIKRGGSGSTSQNPPAALDPLMTQSPSSGDRREVTRERRAR